MDPISYYKKNNYYDKLTYSNIFKTLKNTKQFCMENKITTLALPKICIGLDRKQWNIIADMIKFIFQDSITKIRIYSLPEHSNNNLIKNGPHINYNIISKNNLNNNLKNKITLIAGSFNKIKDVPKDGDCGAHVLRICLQYYDIIKTTVEILNMLSIPNKNSGYQLTDDDLAYICDQFNMNLFLIYELNGESYTIVYWKTDRPNIGIFHKNNHWTPGISVEIESPRIFNNVTIYTNFPNIDTIKRDINKYLKEQENNTWISNTNYITDRNKNQENNIKTDTEFKQRVLAIKKEINGNEKYATLDTGSNISCIDYLLIKNKQKLKPKENVIITGADSTELTQLGKIELNIKINNEQYNINAYVIEGLHCKLLLGNDFHIENNVIIDFKNKNIQIKDSIIPMDEIWYDLHNKNNNNVRTEINLASIKINTNFIGHIVADDNITISPKSKINIKNIHITTDRQGSNYVIEPIESIYKRKYLVLESTTVGKEDGIIFYNFSNGYGNIPKGMKLANIISTDAEKKLDELPEVKTIGTTTLKHTDSNDLNEVTDKQGNIIKISHELNNNQRKKALKLINNYKHLFTLDPLDIDCANVEPCEIKLKSDKPIFQPPFRVSPSQRNKLKLLIDQMIRADIIEPSRSNYVAPVFLIPKKEKGEYCFLVDYRKLNNETIADKHPIPRSQDLFRSLEGAKYYSTLDMAQGYFQIPIK